MFVDGSWSLTRAFARRSSTVFVIGSLISYRDRLITIVNITGDALGTGIVEHLSRHEMYEIPENNNPQDQCLAEKHLDGNESDAHLMSSGV